MQEYTTTTAYVHAQAHACMYAICVCLHARTYVRINYEGVSVQVCMQLGIYVRMHMSMRACSALVRLRAYTCMNVRCTLYLHCCNDMQSSISLEIYCVQLCMYTYVSVYVHAHDRTWHLN